MIKAKWTIKVNKTIHKVGALISGLSLLEEDRLIKMGAAERYFEAEIQPEGKVETPLSVEIKAFKETLNTMSKEEIKAYAELAEVKTGNRGKEKSIDVLVEDAKEKGIDADAFDDVQLEVFANMLNISTEEIGREDILKEIESILTLKTDE